VPDLLAILSDHVARIFRAPPKTGETGRTLALLRQPNAHYLGRRDLAGARAIPGSVRSPATSREVQKRKNYSQSRENDIRSRFANLPSITLSRHSRRGSLGKPASPHVGHKISALSEIADMPVECWEENVGFISAIKSRTEFSGLPLLARFAGHRGNNVANRDAGACPGHQSGSAGRQSRAACHTCLASVFFAHAYGIIVITRRCARLLANKKPSSPLETHAAGFCTRVVRASSTSAENGRSQRENR